MKTGNRGMLLGWRQKRHYLVKTSITQTFLNSKFEIVYFKAGGWMGAEEGEKQKDKRKLMEQVSARLRTVSEAGGDLRVGGAVLC